ncbi:MAG TPA: hypothetical protein VHE81_11725 [Lacipirellulaceae bacterium]|nr:hypothetical protein [Lacipirellulaceae bacterium]
MQILAQFLLRLAFGLATGMGITSSRQVTSGFFRNHLYVTLGLATLAAMLLASLSTTAMWLAVAAAIFSYVGAAAWLYEARRLGKVMLWLVAACSLTAAVINPLVASTTQAIASIQLWSSFSVATSGLVLGLTMAAMLLGHWYLNAPGMELAPLRYLLAAAAVALLIQSLVVGSGLVAEISARPSVSIAWLLFVVLRWSFGICGVLALLWMAWRTLDIPNTQSATGILYVAVLGVFIGELTGLLLSAESLYPL